MSQDRIQLTLGDSSGTIRLTDTILKSLQQRSDPQSAATALLEVTQE